MTFFSFSLFRFQSDISFKEILRCFGHSPCVVPFIGQGLFFLHKQFRTLCNNKPESFSVPSCLAAILF